MNLNMNGKWTYVVHNDNSLLNIYSILGAVTGHRAARFRQDATASGQWWKWQARGVEEARRASYIHAASIRLRGLLELSQGKSNCHFALLSMRCGLGFARGTIYPRCEFRSSFSLRDCMCVCVCARARVCMYMSDPWLSFSLRLYYLLWNISRPTRRFAHSSVSNAFARFILYQAISHGEHVFVNKRRKKNFQVQNRTSILDI